jgi:hypothetical protein
MSLITKSSQVYCLENKCCLLCDSFETHKYTQWTKCRALNVEAGGAKSNQYVLKGQPYGLTLAVLRMLTSTGE